VAGGGADIRRIETEGRMSGYMVTTLGGGYRNFYMVNAENPERARAEVNKEYKGTNAEVLAPVSDETLAHFATVPASIWLCCTVEEATGKVTSNQFGEEGRQFIVPEVSWRV
jgi:hypothetical protein